MLLIFSHVVVSMTAPNKAHGVPTVSVHADSTSQKVALNCLFLFLLLILHHLTTSSSSCFQHMPPGDLICLFPIPLLPLLNDDLPSQRTAPLFSATPHWPHPPVSTPGTILCAHNSFLHLLQHPTLVKTLRPCSAKINSDYKLDCTARLYEP